MLVHGGPHRRRRASNLATAATPGDINAAQAGLLLSGRLRPQHLVAELVDLAVRGYLRIDEHSTGRARNWQLVGVREPGPDLRPYEATLLHALFADRDAVGLNELRHATAEAMHNTRNQMVDDAVQRGWFRRHPHTQRKTLIGIGWVLLAASGITMLGTGSILIGAAVFATGVSVAVIGFSAAPRTAAGSTLRARVHAYRSELRTGTPLAASPHGDIEHQYSKHLPYAIAFGLDRHWAFRFASLTDEPIFPPWYTGDTPTTSASFSHHAAMFITTATTALAGSASDSATTGNSGSGITSGSSGGGDGGGGGGSW